MAYDFVVGKSNREKDAPDIVGGIEFSELPSISRLLKRVGSPFLHRISNLFEDQSFSLDEVDQALLQLLPLLALRLRSDERIVLQKIVSVLAYAQWKQLGLYGVAD